MDFQEFWIRQALTEHSLNTQFKTSKNQEFRRAQGETGTGGTELFLNFKRVLVLLYIKPELLQFA